MLDFFHLFVKLESQDLPYPGYSGQLFFFTNACKQMTKERMIIAD